MTDIFWKMMFSTLKNYMNYITFLPERMKVKKSQKAFS